MEEQLRRKLAVLSAIARCDEEYVHLMEKLKREEKELDRQETAMCQTQRDAMWDYIGSCEAVSCRLLELACIHMEFMDKQER